MGFKGTESYGTILYISTAMSTVGTTSSTFTKVGGLISLPGPEMATDVVEKSIIDSTDHLKGKAAEDIDPGQMTPTFAYKRTETGQAKLIAAFMNRTNCVWKITHPTTTDFQPEYYRGFPSGLGRSIDKGSVMIRSATITLTTGKGFKST